MTEHQKDANWNAAEWHGKMLVDRDGERIGKLHDVYVDVENDEPQFATVKEGLGSRGGRNTPQIEGLPDLSARRG